MDTDFLERSTSLIASHDFLSLALEVLYLLNWNRQRLEDVWTKIDAHYNSPPLVSSELTGRILELFEGKAGAESSLPFGAPRYYKAYWEERIQYPHRRSPTQYLFLFAGWELRQAICLVYGKSIVGGESKYRERLAEYAGRWPLSVIDFNYDLYFEQTLANEGWFYYPDSSPRLGAVEILKPHGSLNWVHRNVGKPVEAISVIRDVYPIHSWGYGPEGLSQASIIPMPRAKREFTPDEESEVVRFRYGRILRRCEDVLKQAQHICIIGYSFPQGDRHFHDVLLDVRTNRVAPLRSLKYIGLDGTVLEWTRKLRGIFGIGLDPEVSLHGF